MLLKPPGMRTSRMCAPWAPAAPLPHLCTCACALSAAAPPAMRTSNAAPRTLLHCPPCRQRFSLGEAKLSPRLPRAEGTMALLPTVRGGRGGKAAVSAVRRGALAAHALPAAALPLHAPPGRPSPLRRQVPHHKWPCVPPSLPDLGAQHRGVHGAWDGVAGRWVWGGGGVQQRGQAASTGRALPAAALASGHGPPKPRAHMSYHTILQTVRHSQTRRPGASG